MLARKFGWLICGVLLFSTPCFAVGLRGPRARYALVLVPAASQYSAPLTLSAPAMTGPTYTAQPFGFREALAEQAGVTPHAYAPHMYGTSAYSSAGLVPAPQQLFGRRHGGQGGFDGTDPAAVRDFAKLLAEELDKIRPPAQTPGTPTPMLPPDAPPDAPPEPPVPARTISVAEGLLIRNCSRCHVASNPKLTAKMPVLFQPGATDGQPAFIPPPIALKAKILKSIELGQMPPADAGDPLGNEEFLTVRDWLVQLPSP